MSCKIKLADGGVSQVLAANGNPSKLYQQILTLPFVQGEEDAIAYYQQTLKAKDVISDENNEPILFSTARSSYNKLGLPNHNVYTNSFSEALTTDKENKGVEVGFLKKRSEVSIKDPKNLFTSVRNTALYSNKQITAQKGNEIIVVDPSANNFQTLSQVSRNTKDKTVSGFVNGLMSQGFLKPSKTKNLYLNSSETINQVLQNDQNNLLYHGSPYSFDRFSMDKIGTGEGFNMFGWGLYFTDVKDVAKSYATNNRINTNNRYINLLSTDFNTTDITKSIALLETMAEDIMEFDPTQYNEINTVLDFLRNAKKQGVTNTQDLVERGYVYSVSLNKNLSDLNMISWYDEVPTELSSKIDKVKVEPNETFEQLYKRLGTPQEASTYLKELGFDGIKYPTDTLSQNGNQNGFNYVLFTDEIIVQSTPTTGKTISQATSELINSGVIQASCKF